MKILSVNCGSSSLKFQMYEMPEEKVLIWGYFEKIGSKDSFYSIKINGEKTRKEVNVENHEQAFHLLVEELLNNNIIKDPEEIKGIGHRIVQGGAYFDKTVEATPDTIAKVEELGALAPLHNPAAVVGIKAAIKVFPNALQTVVFDTAFHQTMDETSYIYAVPYEWYEKYQIRRYGAHGTSHKYLTKEMNKILGREDTKLITCHIGNGASISAVKDGKCIDTSMGLTPNAGLIMGTRCGDMDATIVTYMIDKLGLSGKEMDTILNRESGLLGISGISNDHRDVEQGIEAGNKRCLLAHKMFIKSIISFIAKYYVELGGCDAIIFSAGVGENSAKTRHDVMEGLKVLGITINEENNNTRGKLIKVSGDDSKILVYVIPTDEEVMIARDTYNLVQK
ncbi:MAG TPA: acetate kinase [Bacilli bacterium]|nr:acetate kinase [Bacilli bacterium]